jgi:hypothetical protein
MLFSKYLNIKNQQAIIIGVILLILISLNFYLLNKVIPNSEMQRSIEKNIRI